MHENKYLHVHADTDTHAHTHTHTHTHKHTNTHTHTHTHGALFYARSWTLGLRFRVLGFRFRGFRSEV